MMVAPGPIVRLFFLRIVADAPLPVAGEHHRVGRLYSHSATSDRRTRSGQLRATIIELSFSFFLTIPTQTT